MKLIFKIVLLVLLSINYSCKNSTSTEADTQTDNTTPSLTAETTKESPSKAGFASLSFAMDGTYVEGAVPGVMALYNPSKKEVNIMAGTPQGNFAIVIDNVEGTGTFTIKGTSSSGAGIINMSTQKMYEVKKSGTPFTVTINSITDIAAMATPDAKAISGTFEGTLMDDAGNTVKITEGKFSTQ